MPTVPRGLWVFGGLLLAGVALHLATAGPAARAVGPRARASAPSTPRSRAPASRAPGAPSPAPGAAAAALAAAGGPRRAAIEQVPAPGLPGVVWALDPTPVAGRWWFGVATAGHWRWAGIPPTQALPAWWPPAPRIVLADAAALAQGTVSTAPAVGLAPWNTVTGHVRAPVCWTLTRTNGAVVLAAVLPSLAYPAVAYELSTTWTAANRLTGRGAFNGLVPLTGGPTAWCPPA